MSKTEAHRLADELEEAAGEYWRFHKSTGYGAAAELRRLARVEAQRDALRAELKEATEAINDPAVNNLRTLPESIRVLCAQQDQRAPESTYHPCTFILIKGLKKLKAWDVLAEWDKAREIVDKRLRAAPPQQVKLDDPERRCGGPGCDMTCCQPLAQQDEPVEPVAWVGDPSTQDYASTQPEPDAYGYASRLAFAIWNKHYKDTAPQWKLLDDLMGVPTQIDNMTSGLTRLAQQDEPVEPVATLTAQRDALLEALKGLMQQYKDQPECFMDWSKARAAIKAVEEGK